jgi:uncharacterized Zn-finger protein
MAESAEIIQTEAVQVNCDGGGGALGHPRIYLQIKSEIGKIECPYCGRRYVLKQGAQSKNGAL